LEAARGSESGGPSGIFQVIIPLTFADNLMLGATPLPCHRVGERMQDKIPEDIKKEISRALLDFVKTIKVVSVYPENNPLPQKLKESFTYRFLDLIRETGGLVFSVSRDEIRYQGEIVFADGASEDSLAKIFFDSGITELSFARDFGVESANQLFRIMKAFINREEGAGDLVTLFWQANIVGFDYCTLEDLVLREYSGGMMIQESMTCDDSFIRRRGGDDDSGKVIYSSIFLDDDGVATQTPVQVQHAVGLSNIADKETLVFSDEIAERTMGLNPIPQKGKTTVADTALILNEAFVMAEIDADKVEEMLRLDADFDCHKTTIELIQEIIRQETEFSEFNETIATVEKLQAEFLKTGHLERAGEMLHILETIKNQWKTSRPQWAERASNALVMAASRERLDHLKAALNNKPHIVEKQINDYLSAFGWEALSAVAGLLGELEHREHREALCAYLARTGQEHVDIIAQGIYDRRWFVVRNTAAILAKIGNDRAFLHLEKAISHEDSRVRLEVAKGLMSDKTLRGIKILGKLIWDKDPIVSQTAIDSLMEFPADLPGQLGEQLLGVIEEILNDQRFPTIIPPNQEKIIISFSRLGGEYAVGYLTSLISKWGIVKSRSQEFYQETAFKALGYNKSEKAEKALLKYNQSWNKKLRKLAGESLAHRRHIIYGGR
jgi:hypothetical protein